MIRGPTIRCVWLACLLAVAGARGDLTVPSTAPAYTAAGVVQAATQAAGPLAPNTIATIYGANLAYSTHAVSPGDLVGGALPTTLDGVRVIMYGFYCGLFYVSPGQINFLVPYALTAASAPLQVTRQGVAGLPVTIQMAATAAAFFQWNGNLAIGTHPDGSLITAAAPAQPGEAITMWAAGLGPTLPPQITDRPPSASTPIASALYISLNGQPAGTVTYAGVAPGFAGLYQINLQLPQTLPSNPQIQVTMGTQSSPPEILLPTQGPAQ